MLAFHGFVQYVYMCVYWNAYVTSLCGSCRLRVFFFFVINHNWFGNIILVCIMVSSMLLACEDPVEPNSRRNEVYLFPHSSPLLFFQPIPTPSCVSKALLAPTSNMQLPFQPTVPSVQRVFHSQPCFV